MRCGRAYGDGDGQFRRHFECHDESKRRQMLLFIDESGHDHSGGPCEVLAGVAVAEDNPWNLVRAIRSAERDFFGDYLRNLLKDETKAKNLLKRSRFKEAAKPSNFATGEQVVLAHSLLQKKLRRRLANQRANQRFAKSLPIAGNHLISYMPS